MYSLSLGWLLKSLVTARTCSLLAVFEFIVFGKDIFTNTSLAPRLKAKLRYRLQFRMVHVQSRDVTRDVFYFH